MAKPLETVMPAHTLACTWTLTSAFTELAQEAQSLDSVGPLPTLPPNFLLELSILYHNQIRGWLRVAGSLGSASLLPAS